MPPQGLHPGGTSWRSNKSVHTRVQGSGVAAALVQTGSCSSDVTPSLGTSICCGCAPTPQRPGPNGGQLISRIHGLCSPLSLRPVCHHPMASQGLSKTAPLGFFSMQRANAIGIWTASGPCEASMNNNPSSPPPAPQPRLPHSPRSGTDHAQGAHDTLCPSKTCCSLTRELHRVRGVQRGAR